MSAIDRARWGISDRRELGSFRLALTSLTGYQNLGVPNEGCFPYTAGNQACSQCADWANRATKITTAEEYQPPKQPLEVVRPGCVRCFAPGSCSRHPLARSPHRTRVCLVPIGR